MFASAIAVFTVASVLCAMTNTFTEFVAARVLQGIGGAMMVPVGRLAVLRMTPREGLMRAIAIITWPGLVAPVIGPPLGGFLTTYFSWRWIFYLNVPLGLSAYSSRCVCWTTLGRAGPASVRYRRLLALRRGLCQPAVRDGTCRARRYFLGAGWFCFCIERDLLILRVAAPQACKERGNRPVVLRRIKTFAVVMGGGSLFRIAISAVPFLLPLMFQVGFGMDAFESGVLTLAVFAGNLVMKLVSYSSCTTVRFSVSVDCQRGIASATVAMTSLLSAGTPTEIILLVLFLGGLARSLQFTALNTLSFADVPKPQLSAATSLSSTIQQLGVGIGVAVGAMSLQLARWLLGHNSDAMTAADFRLGLSVRRRDRSVGHSRCCRATARRGCGGQRTSTAR